jgi:hypothetical protein
MLSAHEGQVFMGGIFQRCSDGFKPNRTDRSGSIVGTAGAGLGSWPVPGGARTPHERCVQSVPSHVQVSPR